MVGKSCASLVLTLTFGAVLAFGQTATGTPPFGSFGGGPFDIVNLGNLNVHFDVPITNRPSRMPLIFNLSYDSSIWYPVGTGGSQNWVSVPNWGWKQQTDAAYGYISYSSYEIICYTLDHGIEIPTGTQWTYSSWRYVDRGGTYHPFSGFTRVYTGSCSGGNTTLQTYATDGSGYYLNASGSGGTITSPAGTLFNVPINSTSGTATVTDSNGNQISVNGSGQFFDTLSTSTAALTVSGTAPTPTSMTYTSPSGNVSYTINYKSYTVQTDFQCSGISEYGPLQQYLVDNISLPDGSYYRFLYEQTPGQSNQNVVTGRPAQVTLPTGGTISYAYPGANDGIECSDGSTASLNRTLNPGGEWQYARTNISGWQWKTQITTPSDPANQNSASDAVTLQFQAYGSNFYETQRQVYQGSSSGTLLQTTLTCYNGNSVGTPANCPTTAVTPPFARTTVFRYVPNSSGVQAETDTDYNSYGLVTDVYDYDFGSGHVGSLLRHTITSYANVGNGIVNRPACVQVTAGSSPACGTITSDTVSATTYTNYDAHGNAKTISSWVSGSNWLSRSFTYYASGLVDIATDVNGAQTTYTYGDCNSSLLTNIAEPLSLSKSMHFDCNGGVLLWTKDENQQQTTYSYDVMWRMNQVNYPDGGEITTNYNLSSNPANITVNQLIDSSGHWLTTETNLDGLGRIVKKQLTSDPNGTSYADTTYDALGRVASTSNPYYTSGDPTYGVTGYAYDALGRVITITNPDSSQRLMAYSGAWANVQDEGNGNGTSRVIKLYQLDGLGRLITACEVTSATQMGNGSPANCGAYGATGFLTRYTYDALGNITYMTQGAQNRTYNYDGLSRLTLDANPEAWGPTTYTYDATGQQGDLYQRSQPKQNLGSGNGTWTASYTFDALHRMTGVSYNDGTTPSGQWIYDSASPWGKTATNSKGRLVATRVNNASTGALIAGEGFITHDPMGRVQWRLQNGQGSEYDLNYTYDYLGDVRTATNGSGVTLSSTYNTAAELSGVTSSLNDANHPGTLFEGPQYNALGQVTTDNLGFLNEHYGYTNRGWLYSYWACTVPGVSCSNSQMAYTFNMQTGNNQQPLGFAPNGDVVAANDWINGNWTYTYDDFNRLSTSYCGTNCPGGQSALGFAYLYDRFGNRWQQNATAGSGLHPQYSFDGNGHITSSGVLYDAAGNMIGDGSHTYFYDAENRVIQVGGTSGQCSTATACYVYNASRQRVSKTTSAGTVYYVYDILGHQVAEFSSSGAWNRGEVYAGSKHLATYVGGTSGSTYLNLADWAGTERMRVNSKQSPQETCTSLPFGDMQSCTGADESPMHFTGQQWDSEDNMTNFWFRQHSPTQGRWGSMDPAGLSAVDPSNPQTWNRYAYVINNPVSLIDPMGLYIANPCYNDPTCGGDGGPGGDPCLNCGSGPLLPVTPPGGTDAGGGGGAGKRPTCGIVPLRPCPAANNFVQQKQFNTLTGCVKNKYNIDLRNFVPVAPGSNGYFYGLSPQGDVTVETNVTHSSWTLGLMSAKPWPVAGLTYGSSAPNQLNYLASDQIGEAAGIDPNQIHELGHALDNFTFGATSEASADLLMNCVISNH